MSDCPPEEKLAEFVAGGCSPPEAEVIEAHLRDCTRCSTWVRRARSDDVWLDKEVADRRREREPYGVFTGDGTLSTKKPFYSQPSAPSIPGYEIIRELHRGGQGVVYQAIQKSTKRRVAIKVMREGPFSGPRDKVRFEREVQILGQLNHPHIVAIHDSGTAAGHFYYTMDYISGRPLDDYVASTKPGIDETLRLFAKICEAVNAAHLRGVIHRDLKPGNIRIDAQGEPHVLDFGLAKVATGDVTDGSQPQVMTVTGQFFGSLPWASPEQAEAIPSKIDIRTDVYSLGVSLYHMLTGQFPYQVVGNVRDVMDNILRAEPAKPSTIRRQINGEVETIVLKCLAKERERRYQSAGELARDIHHYLAGEPIEAKRDSGLYVLRKTLRRYKVPMAVAGAFVVLLAVSLTVMSALYIRAEAAKRIASGEQAEAMRQRSEAERHRALAEQKSIEAHQARDTAEARAEELRRTAYCDLIHLAAAMWEQHEIEQMGDYLERCDIDLRHWEWDYLNWLTRRGVLVLRGHESEVTGVAIGLDGQRLLSGSKDKTVRIWDTGTGQELIKKYYHDYAVRAVAFSPHGELCATTDGLSIRLWNAQHGGEVFRLRGHEKLVHALAFSPDGKCLASGSYDGELRLWDTTTGTELRTVRAHRGAVKAISFGPNSRLMATASTDRMVKLWTAKSCEELMALRGHGNSVLSTAFSPDGKRLVSGGEDRCIKLWSTGTGVNTLTVHGREVFCAVAFAPDGKRFVSGGSSGALRFWDSQTGQEVLRYQGHREPINAIALSRDGKRLASGSGDATIKVWTAIDTPEIVALRADEDGSRRIAKPLVARAMDVSNGASRLLSVDHENSINLWDVSTEACALSLTCPERVCSACISPDEPWVAVGCGDGTLRTWDAVTGQAMLTLAAHKGRVSAVAFAPKENWIASGAGSGRVKLWDAVTGQQVLSLAGHASTISALAFSPNGSLIASGSHDEDVRLWNVTTGKMALILRGHNGWISALSFSPDGKGIASGSGDKTIRLWATDSGRVAHMLRGHQRAVRAVAFSSDGRRIASGSEDGTVKIWDTQTGRGLLTLRAHQDSVIAVAFAKSQRHLVSGGADLTMGRWLCGP